MGKKVKVTIEQLEDGWLANIKIGLIRGNTKVSSDTLKNTLKKVVAKVTSVYGREYEED